jgi:hypothetical protein
MKLVCTGMRTAHGLMLVVVLGSGVSPTANAESGPAAFRAEYIVMYKGRESGEATFELSYDAATETYEFVSETRLRGLLLRAVSPNPVIDRSRFRYTDAHIEPIEFSNEDGSRSGDGNQHVDFDWESGQATLQNEDGTRDVPIEKGVVDRASQQIALMSALAGNRVPGRISVADGDSVSSYEITVDGTRVVDTELGELEVVRINQQREGSSRTTVYQFAPSLHYIPVSIEQYRDGEAQFGWFIEAVD